MVYLHLTEVAEVDARAVIETIFQRPPGGGKRSNKGNGWRGGQR
jgi:hypothetical protein